MKQLYKLPFVSSLSALLLCSLFSCSPDPGYVDERYRIKPYDYSWEPHDHASEDSTAILDTVFGAFTFGIYRENADLAFSVAVDDPAWYAGDTTNETVKCFFEFSFYEKKKRIQFPFRSMYTYPYWYGRNRYYDWQNCPSEQFRMNESGSWAQEIPLSYFADLKAGKHRLTCKIKRTLLHIPREDPKDSLQLKQKHREKKEDIKIKREYSYYSFPFELEIPVLYLKKVQVGKFALPDKRDYDVGFVGKPDVFFYLENGFDFTYRSGDCDQCIESGFKETIYLFSTESVFNNYTLEYWDEDVIYHDYLGGYYIDFPDKDTTVRLPSDSLMQWAEYRTWKAKRFN